MMAMGGKERLAAHELGCRTHTRWKMLERRMGKRRRRKGRTFGSEKSDPTRLLERRARTWRATSSPRRIGG